MADLPICTQRVLLSFVKLEVVLQIVKSFLMAMHVCSGLNLIQWQLYWAYYSTGTTLLFHAATLPCNTVSLCLVLVYFGQPVNNSQITVPIIKKVCSREAVSGINWRFTVISIFIFSTCAFNCNLDFHVTQPGYRLLLIFATFFWKIAASMCTTTFFAAISTQQ